MNEIMDLQDYVRARLENANNRLRALALDVIEIDRPYISGLKDVDNESGEIEALTFKLSFAHISQLNFAIDMLLDSVTQAYPHTPGNPINALTDIIWVRQGIELTDVYGKYVLGCRVSITRNISFELAKKEWLKIKGKS